MRHYSHFRCRIGSVALNGTQKYTNMEAVMASEAASQQPQQRGLNISDVCEYPTRYDVTGYDVTPCPISGYDVTPRPVSWYDVIQV